VHKVPSALAVSVNEWHHIAITYSHRTRKLEFYLDGCSQVIDLTHILELSDIPLFIPPTSAFIGGRPALSPESCSLNGSIAEVFLFDSTLRQHHIQYLGNHYGMTVKKENFVCRLAQKYITQGLTNVTANSINYWWNLIPMNEQLYLATHLTEPERLDCPSYENLSQMITKLAGSPSDGNNKVTRDKLSILCSQKIHLDVLGEGLYRAHPEKEGLLSGFEQSLNINYRSQQTLQPRDIPNLIHIRELTTSWPLSNGFSDYTTLVDFPLVDSKMSLISELARTARCPGTLAFWNQPDQLPHIESLRKELEGKYACYTLLTKNDFNELSSEPFALCRDACKYTITLSPFKFEEL